VASTSLWRHEETLEGRVAASIGDPWQAAEAPLRSPRNRTSDSSCRVRLRDSGFAARQSALVQHARPYLDAPNDDVRRTWRFGMQRLSTWTRQITTVALLVVGMPALLAAQKPKSAASNAASTASKPGAPPKPGLVSCAGKFEGRYATTGSAMGSFTIVFRSGKATMIDSGSNEEHFDCWTGGGKILLHQPGRDNMDMPIDVNDDGSLQTPIGEIRKKGS